MQNQSRKKHDYYKCQSQEHGRNEDGFTSLSLVNVPLKPKHVAPTKPAGDPNIIYNMSDHK